ncbi:MAG: hypothetical protein HOV96_37765 [Nonomuraea sp.]|nr:hypothetical protein [Nonomuraea sp.]NUP83293.1 hypothetical protein [Nonomuraea sp.]NUS01664.1 hypothetical protein [Nonomuraea sp.]
MERERPLRTRSIARRREPTDGRPERPLPAGADLPVAGQGVRVPPV